jgi:maleylpyruvate isomerase
VSYVSAIRPEILAWWREGEQTLAAAVSALPDAGLAGPSLLPGWTRQTLLAHLGLNADALINLLTWARTGVETPMYASAQARDDEIAETAARPAAEVRAEFAAGQARLAEAVDQMPDVAWPTLVRNGQGRMVPATEVPWMRMRETWVHVVDLAGPVTFADIPAEVTSALVENIVSGWQAREDVGGLTFAAADTGQRWGDGPRVISARRADLLAWMAGRGSAGAIDFDGPPWPPPPWL